jgi:hypothetical protein
MSQKEFQRVKVIENAAGGWLSVCEAAVDGRWDGVAASGDGWESVHDTTLATLDEQSRCRVGPKILFDRPARDPPSPPPSNFPVG